MGTHTGSVFQITLGWQQVYGGTHWISISYCTGLATGLWGHTLDQYFKLHWVGNRSMGTHTGSVFQITLGWQQVYGETHWISISYCTGLAIGLWGHTLDQYFKLHWVGNRSMGTCTGSVFQITLGWQQVYGETHWISISYCTGLAIGLWGHTLDQYFKLHWVGNRSMGTCTGSVFQITLGWQQVYGETHWISISN